MPVDDVSPQRRYRRSTGCSARLRHKYGWCCRSTRRPRKVAKTDNTRLVPPTPLEQLFSWAVPSRRVTRPATGTRGSTPSDWEAVAGEGLRHTTAPTRASASASSAPAPAPAPASASASVSASATASASASASIGDVGDAGGSANNVTGIAPPHVSATAGPDNGMEHEEGGETVMVPLVGHDEQVEGASFMPRIFCSSDDDALRKWEAGDLSVQAVDAEIGGGTFAKVLFGETRLGVLVAIKAIGRESEDFGCQDKFIKREIQTLTMTADHPNVVDILGTLSTVPTTFMIMPLVKTDAKVLIKEKVLNEEEAAAIALQLMLAVEYMHSKNIVHRDLKPANLLITEDKQLRLADFGFAKMLEEGADTMTGLCGTKPYLSPEQVNNFPYGTAADMWAAGVVVYELLMGVTAFCPDSSIDLGPIAMDVGTPQPKEGDIRMHLDPYDELERENIRAGVFEVDSDRVGAVGENFLRKLIVLDPTERMSARQAGEHAWLGGREAVELKRAEAEAITKARQEEREAQQKERTQLLRSRRRRKVPKIIMTTRVPALVAEGASATAAGPGIPRAMMAEASGSKAAAEMNGAPATAPVATATAEGVAADGA